MLSFPVWTLYAPYLWCKKCSPCPSKRLCLTWNQGWRKPWKLGSAGGFLFCSYIYSIGYVALFVHLYLIWVSCHFDCCHVFYHSDMVCNLSCCLNLSWWYCFMFLSNFWSYQNNSQPSLLRLHAPLVYCCVAHTISHSITLGMLLPTNTLS